MLMPVAMYVKQRAEFPALIEPARVHQPSFVHTHIGAVVAHIDPPVRQHIRGLDDTYSKGIHPVKKPRWKQKTVTEVLSQGPPCLSVHCGHQQDLPSQFLSRVGQVGAFKEVVQCLGQLHGPFSVSPETLSHAVYNDVAYQPLHRCVVLGSAQVSGGIVVRDPLPDNGIYIPRFHGIVLLSTVYRITECVIFHLDSLLCIKPLHSFADGHAPEYDQ